MTSPEESSLPQDQQLMPEDGAAKSPEESTIPPEWIELRNDAQKYKELILTTVPGASRSCQHILRNLVAGCNLALVYGVADMNHQEYEECRHTVDSIKRYFQLLEDFPEFKAKELAEGEGYFPDMFEQFFGGEQFIDVYEARLRGTNNTDKVAE